MYRVDITADLNDEAETGYVWTFLDEASVHGANQARCHRRYRGSRCRSGMRGDRPSRDRGHAQGRRSRRRQAGVRVWVAEAATEKARAAALHAAGRAAAPELVAGYENEHGPLPAESRQRARQFLIGDRADRRRAEQGRRVMPAIVYDTGALLAAERRNPDFLALHDELTSARIRPLVPVVVLAQAWRGGPQDQISRVLAACDILPDASPPGFSRRIGSACWSSACIPDKATWPVRSFPGQAGARRGRGSAHARDGLGPRARRRTR